MDFTGLVTGDSGNIELEEAWLNEVENIFSLFCKKQTSYGPNNIAETREMGVIIRLNDKIKRLLNLVIKGQPNKLTDETIDDTLMDIADYAIIALMCRHDRWRNMMRRYMKQALTFDDVLLVPKYSEVTHRNSCNTTTWLGSKISLRVPIISANMDTVTDYRMAAEIARLGGLGIIHRFMSQPEQCTHVRRVKEGVKFTVGAAVGVKAEDKERVMALESVGTDLIVVDIAHGHSKDCLSMVSWIRKEFPNMPIMAGNVATYQGALDLTKAGANIIKCGIGPGSVCTTRVVTGFGVPQITAIMDCVNGTRAAGADFTAVVADGGIRSSGDILKALAAGAKAVMLGSLLAGCDETPGEPTRIGNDYYKVYRGMASMEAQLDRENGPETQASWKKVTPEGVTVSISCKGPVSLIIEELVGGIKSGMSYCGVDNLHNFAVDAEFVQVTNAGLIESRPHICQ